MSKITVVGSGASAVHFALSLLEKGYEVLMLDVGRTHPAPIRPDDSLRELKQNLEDPVEYLLGGDLESVIYPDQDGEYYGFPPSKTHVFARADQFPVNATGFAPLASFARGGLAEAWTGGVYPLNEAELREFPFSFKDLSPFYDLVAKRIGVSGEIDDLSRFMPVHDHLMEPLELDEHSSRLLHAYARRRHRVNSRHRSYLGRSRIATLTKDVDGRRRCGYLGRCLWGCPREALYTPSVTLRECERFDKFRYVPGVYVNHFEVDTNRRVVALETRDVRTGTSERLAVDLLVLAAGTLSSSEIYLESMLRHSGDILTLNGLMDNRQVLVPFVNLTMLGRPFNPDTYQYHQLGLGIEQDQPEEYVHGQITTLKTAPIHPIVQRFPADLRTSLFLFRNMHSALGLVNVNFFDTRREGNAVTLESGTDGRFRLVLRYAPPSDESQRLKRTTKTLRAVLWELNCVLAPGLSHRRPMGASVHYAGLLPMSRKAADHTTSTLCQSHDFQNLFIVDGTTLPFLPAKNLTFTLMANAARVAAQAF